MSSEMKPCPECGGEPLLCTPNYADEGGTMVVCQNCDFAGDSFVLGLHAEGIEQAIEAWNDLHRETNEPWSQPLLDCNGAELNVGDNIRYERVDKVRFATITDTTGDGRLWCDDNLFDIMPSEVTKVFTDPLERLEQDMRRYLYDKTPDRRIQCLTAFQERMGYRTWAEREEIRSQAERARLMKEYGLDN